MLMLGAGSVRRVRLAAIAAVCLVTGGCFLVPASQPELPPTPENVDGFLARTYTARGFAMPYRLFVPPGYDSTVGYPLVVWLHGAGGIGIDNLREIAADQIPGTHSWITPASQAAHPTFVVAPQSRGTWTGTALTGVLAIVKELEGRYHIDPKRIYLAGQSLGGGGTWALITRRSHPFAAAIVLCGVYPDTTRAAMAASLPLWIFQGDLDTPAVVQDARTMVVGLKKAGGSPRYTEYKGVGHDIWNLTFAEPGLADWLFAQHR